MNFGKILLGVILLVLVIPIWSSVNTDGWDVTTVGIWIIVPVILVLGVGLKWLAGKGDFE